MMNISSQLLFRALKYSFGLTVPLSVFIALYFQGMWSYLPLAYAFGLIPLLELISPVSEKNLNKAEEEVARKNRIYDWLIYLNVPLHLALMAFFLYVMATQPLAGFERTGLIIAWGLSCGAIGINVAHELGHRKKKYERFMAKLLLMTTLYMHFIIEHNRGHHKRVSTGEDPASARYGEILYPFIVRSVVKGYLSAWELEHNRLRKKGLALFSHHNEMLRFTLIQALLIGAIGFFLGLQVLWAFIASAMIGIGLLETINYVEHYGLRRKKLDNGRYERVQPVHSWNSDHVIGRVLLYELTRHSDHHYLASRKYQVLRHFDESPQLPSGYPAMIILALFPPLWFAVMNPRVNRLMGRLEGTEPGLA